jgi:hypothetical protein
MAEGSIYRDSWSDSLFYDDETRPKSLYTSYVDRFVAVDCGTDHPQVYGEFYDDGETLWLDREYWWDSHGEMRQKTNGEYADDLVEFMGENNACQVIIPPECASFRAELVLRGLWVTDADNEVEEGIKTVSSLMGMRKLRIHKDNCTNTYRDLLNYVWDPLAAKRGVEQPLKRADDGADMCRYACHTKIANWRLLGEAA